MYTKVMEKRLSVLENQKYAQAMIRDGMKVSNNLWDELEYSNVSKSLETLPLNSEEVSHYDDVRHLFSIAIWLTVIGALVSGYGFYTAGWRSIFRASFYMGCVMVITGAIWSLISWRHMFRTLHWWIFQDSSWILPDGSTSLYLFPYPVWQMAGYYISFLAGGILLGGFLLSFRSKKLSS